MLSPIDQYLAALGQIESSGNYNALGPKTSSGDRAYGKYQVMGSNIPVWSQMATGTKMSPQDFLNSPEAQDAVAKKYFGGYADQYGPQGAASMWFSGKPNVNSSASDGYNTVPQYIAKFNDALKQVQGGGNQSPMSMAFADPNSGLSPDLLRAAAANSPNQPSATPNSVVANDFASLPPANPNSPAQTPASLVARDFNDMSAPQGGMTPNARVAQAFAAMNGSPPAAPAAADAGNAAPTQVSQNGDSDASPSWMGKLAGFGNSLQSAAGYLASINNPAGGAALVEAANRDRAQRLMMMKPQWGVIGKDPWTGTEQYGWIQPFGPNGPQVSPANGSSGGAPAAGSADANAAATNAFGNMSPQQVTQKISDMKAQGATQEQILQALPPTVGGMVSGMLKGAQTPQMLSRQGQMRNLFIGLASQIDPNFDETNYGMRQAQARDLATGGKLGQNLISANQVVNHAGQLFDDIDGLGNKTNSPLVNSWINYGREQSGDTQYQSALAAFNTHKLALSSELVKLMRGTGGAESDIQAWQKEFNAANSTPALKTAVQNSLQIMQGRVEAATNQYNQAYGSNYGPDHFLSPNANATIQRINGTPQQAAGAAPAASQAAAAPSKTLNGKTYHLINGQWYQE